LLFLRNRLSKNHNLFVLPPIHSIPEMKIFSSQHEFAYSWEEVSTANWRKYCPWNDKSPHVIAVDTLDRRIDPKTGIVCTTTATFLIHRGLNTNIHQLRTERLITCKQSAPKWLAAILGSSQDVSHVYETSYVDLSAKQVTMCSQNMTFNDLISVHEIVVYRPGANGRTIFDQHARVIALCGGWQKIKNSIEDFTVARFGENAVKGREGFEAVLEMSRKVFAQERERQARM